MTNEELKTNILNNLAKSRCINPNCKDFRKKVSDEYIKSMLSFIDAPNPYGPKGRYFFVEADKDKVCCVEFKDRLNNEFQRIVENQKKGLK